MPAYLNLSEPSRRDLENLLLTVQGAYLRTLQAVRTHAEPGWKVRREVERIAEETVERRPFAQAFVRLTETRVERARVAAIAVRWESWQEMDR